MKKILCLITVVVMMLSLAACSKAPVEEDAALDEVVDMPAGSEQEQEPTDQPQTNDPKPSVPEDKPVEDEKEEEPEKKPEENKPEDTAPGDQEPEDTAAPENKEPEDEEIVFEDDEEEPSYEGWIKVASYNTKALMYSKDKEGIVNELKEIDADIVGIQEIDSFTTRSGKYDQMEYLAKECGYPYWSFDKLIDFQGGAYGMGILSRYPIKDSQVVLYDAQEPQDSHVRKYGRHVLDVNGKEVIFYNTHLCVRDDNDSVSKLQLKQALTAMHKDQYAVMTGDFNMKAVTAATVMPGFNKIKLLNDGDKNTTAYIGKKLAADYIDNIFATKTLDAMLDAWSGTGIMVSETPYSDHNLVYTYVNFK
ncbi:MAG: endonuclease/exonuclease/phosphatase family protein [Clostridia bacterium]|nr:endonuclease/exonuclease/phosphatase family protein [Clostridia bacterium]